MKSQKSQRFSKSVANLRKISHINQAGAIHLGTAEDGSLLYIKPDNLLTHCLIMAPTGAGKTFLARQLFRSLARQPWPKTIWADDPKGDLFSALEEDSAALGLEDQTILFDTSRNDRIMSFNPLRKNGLCVEDHALWILGGIRAAWGETSFNSYPQLARWMFNSVAPVIEGEGSFPHALQMLHYEESQIRRFFIERTENQLIRQEWQAYEALGIARRREETASSFARLRPFCINPTIERIMSHTSRSLDLGEVVREGKLLLTTFPRYRPLEPELANMLRSLMLQSILSQAFYYPFPMRPPLYIFLDEAEHALANDTGVLATILNEGRSLGIHLIMMCHSLSQIATKDPNLLSLVLTNARTKILGGGLSQADLHILAEEFFVNEWNPWIIRDELHNLELEPVESIRYQLSQGMSKGSSSSHGFGGSLAFSLARALTESTSLSEGTSDTESLAEAYGRSRNKGKSRGLSQGASAGAGMGMVDGGGLTIGPNGEITHTSSHIASMNQIAGQFRGENTGEFEGEGDSFAYAQGLARSVSNAITKGIARAITMGISPGISISTSKTESIGENTGVTAAPWYEYIKRLRVSKREFLSLQDFLTTKLIQLKGQANAHWAIKTPEGPAVFFKAAFVQSLFFNERKKQGRIQKMREKVFGKPYYTTPEEAKQYREEREEFIKNALLENTQPAPKPEPVEPESYRY